MAKQSSAHLDNFLITGGTGFMAKAIPFGFHVNREHCDLSEREAIHPFLEKLSPRGIIHLAALDIRQSETNPVGACQVNVLATHALALYAQKRNVPFIYISTGAVFQGAQDSVFRETDRPRPANTYGLTKYASEMIVRKLLPDALIVRSGWCYGPCDKRTRIVDAFIEHARRNEPLRASRDHVGSPTLVTDFVEELKNMIEAGVGGTHHLVNAGAATAADIAREVVKELNSRSPIEEFEALRDGPVPRSPSEALSSSNQKLRPWREALRAYVRAKKSTL